MRAVVLVLPLAFAVACVEGAPPPPDTIDERVPLPDAPAPGDGFQLVGPEITIPGGGDQMWCWVPDFTATEEHLVDRVETYQGSNGHHMLAMRSIIPRQPGDLFDCTSSEAMASVEPFMTPNQQNKEGTVNLLNDQLAVRLPAGTTLVMQSHYVNINPEPILVRDVANFIYVQDGEQRIEAQYFVINDGSFEIPANNEHYTHTTACTLDQDFTFSAVAGHMHEWGKHVTIEGLSPTGDVTPIYDVANWNGSDRDAPPVTQFDMSNPLTFHQGDTLQVTCDWVNDTGSPLAFPDEMCDAILVYYPALPEGFINCGS